MAKISVIIPVYNSVKYLKTCINSVINQTFQDFEIICVNDGSTDNSLEILKAYQNKDKRIIIIDQENKGQSIARNAALKIAKGDYIIFIDSDDEIEKNAFETLIKSFDEKTDMVFFQIKGLDDKTKKESLIDKINWLDDDLFNTALKPNEPILINNLFKINHTAWSKMFRREFLTKNNLCFSEGLNFEDTEFFFRYFPMANNVKFLKTPLYTYRRNIGTSLMNNSGETKFDIFKVFDLIEKSLYNFNLYEKTKVDFFAFKYVLFEMCYNQVRKDLKRKFKKEILKDFKKNKLSREEFKKLPKNAQKAYYNLKYGRFPNIFKIEKTEDIKTITILGAKLKFKRRSKYQKIIKVEYSWKGNDKRYNFENRNYKFTTKNIKKCDLLLSLNAAKQNVNIKAKQAWVMTFEPPEPESSKEFKDLFYKYDRAYTSYRPDGSANIINDTALADWWIGFIKYDDLDNLKIPDKKDEIVWVTSMPTLLEGHRKRLKFLDYVKINAPYIKLFGYGIKPIRVKWLAYEHSKYQLGIENTNANDYWTEKMADSFLAYSLPIYYGCPNVEKYFPKESFIRIDIEKPAQALEIIDDAIKNDLWAERFEYILEARDIVLNKLWYPKFTVSEMEKMNFDNLSYKTYKIPICRKHIG